MIPQKSGFRLNCVILQALDKAHHLPKTRPEQDVPSIEALSNILIDRETKETHLYLKIMCLCYFFVY